MAVSAVLFVGAIVAVAVAVNHRTSKPVTVRYRVTGTARGVTIAYSTWHSRTISTNKVTAGALPWNKTVTTRDFVQGGALTLALGAQGGTATCSVTVGDGKPRTATASGPFATADCSGF